MIGENVFLNKKVLKDFVDKAQVFLLEVLGIAGGGLALIILIIVAICWYRKRKNNRYNKMAY